MKKAGRPKGSKAKGRRGGLSPEQYLSKKQAVRLIKYVSLEANEAKRWGRKRAVINELIIDLLLHSGLRASELCQLSIEDLPYTHEKDELFVRTGKGNISRTVELPKRLVQKLNKFIRIHRKNAKPKEPLFVGERGKRLSYSGLYSRIKTIGEGVGLPNLHPHTLRHTFATLLYGIERDLFNVADQLGHSSTDTTKVYAKTNNESRKKQAEALDIGVNNNE